jgi:hypothetical protein
LFRKAVSINEVCICYQFCTALVGRAVEDDVQRSQEQFTA